jgi:hypothetical protein
MNSILPRVLDCKRTNNEHSIFLRTSDRHTVIFEIVCNRDASIGTTFVLQELLEVVHFAARKDLGSHARKIFTNLDRSKGGRGYVKEFFLFLKELNGDAGYYASLVASINEGLTAKEKGQKLAGSTRATCCNDR